MKIGDRNLQEEIEISAGRVQMSDPFKRLPIRPYLLGRRRQRRRRTTPPRLPPRPPHRRRLLSVATERPAGPSARATCSPGLRRS